MRVESCAELHGSLTASRITADLIRAAMRRCDQFGDDDAARQQMRDDCLNTPAHLQADQLAHFDQGHERLIKQRGNT